MDKQPPAATESDDTESDDPRTKEVLPTYNGLTSCSDTQPPKASPALGRALQSMKAQPRTRREPWRKDTAPPESAVVLMKRQ